MADNPSPAASRPNDLTIRAATGFTLFAVAALALWLGDHAFWLLLTLGGLAMQYEWAGLVQRIKNRRLAMLALMAPLSMMSPFADGPGFLALGLLLGAALFVVVADRGWSLAMGLFYTGLPVLALLALREAEHGFLLAFWAMGVVWITDIGAYFAGRNFGGPLLLPQVSPRKTWSGSIGGVVAAIIYGVILAQWFGLPWLLGLASAPLSVLAQAGDMGESYLKRRAGLKDSGNLIPGHGGALDRVDGLVPVAPVALALVLALGAAGHA